MSRYNLEIRVKPRPGLLDPQGKAIYMDLEAASEKDALEKAQAMCRKLIANPVTEDFEVALA